MNRAALIVTALCELSACEPTLTVGEWVCSPDGTPDAAADVHAPLSIPWSTSFENRFCDYTASAGFCYEPGTYRAVSSPAHSGRHAAAFTVRAGAPVDFQSRCVRQGALPKAAYYGVWYLIPSAAQNAGVWNLVHFQGGDQTAQHGLWDISLVNRPDGKLRVVVYDFLNRTGREPTVQVPVPIGSWFHLELYLSRAADATGEVALYQDDQLLLHAADIVTDDTNWGQWYVGNYATALTPADSTLYVDDVTVRATR
ncbi:MAG TPA: heparin lyase I family protein [Polyangiaceae bacterium]|nr:heparin lyase I family protein [Polyangiaceae bacterium]